MCHATVIPRHGTMILVIIEAPTVDTFLRKTFLTATRKFRKSEAVASELSALDLRQSSGSYPLLA